MFAVQCRYYCAYYVIRRYNNRQISQIIRVHCESVLVCHVPPIKFIACVNTPANGRKKSLKRTQHDNLHIIFNIFQQEKLYNQAEKRAA